MAGRVFLDSSFWIALRDRREPWHQMARELTQHLLVDRMQLVFTSLVPAEVYAYFTRAPRIRLQVLDDAPHNRAMKWEPIFPAEELESMELLRQHNGKQYSYCDAVSFLVMRRLQVRRAASFEKHFRQFGEFEVIG